MMQKDRSKKKKLIQGKVISDKMDKTRVMIVETLWRHPVFHKALLHSRKVKFHDEKNEAKIGDTVSALETRPLSKDKRHRLFKILERSK